MTKSLISKYQFLFCNHSAHITDQSANHSLVLAWCSILIVSNIESPIHSSTINIPIILEPTTRQLKILNFLETLVGESTAKDCCVKLYKMLDNKLQIEDYKGLQTFITQLPIHPEYKGYYLKATEAFISCLVKEKTKGETLYKDKDISQLVVYLTS